MPNENEIPGNYSVEADEVFVELPFGVVLRRAAVKSITFSKKMFQDAYESEEEFIKINFPEGFLFTDPPPREEKEEDGVPEKSKEGMN